MKNKDLHTIKTTGFKTPGNYFESFEEKMLSKIEGKNRLDGIHSPGFKIPDGYFETVDDKIMSAIHSEKETKVISLFSWKKVAYVSGFAASLVLAFNLFFNKSNNVSFDDLETASIENYLSQEDLNPYDIASYLNEADLTISDFTDTKLSEESLEDYLLQNSDLENLISDQ